jgi:hypothetical protein
MIATLRTWSHRWKAPLNQRYIMDCRLHSPVKAALHSLKPIATYVVGKDGNVQRAFKIFQR